MTIASGTYRCLWAIVFLLALSSGLVFSGVVLGSVFGMPAQARSFEVEYQGVIEVYEQPHLDDAGNDISRSVTANEYSYFLNINGQRHAVTFTDAKQPRLISGTTVILRGEFIDGKLTVDATDPSAVVVVTDPTTAHNRGDQHLAVILLKGTGQPDPATPALEARLQLTKEYIEEVSYGQATLSWEIFGWYETNVAQDIYDSLETLPVSEDFDLSGFNRYLIIQDGNQCGNCGTIGMISETVSTPFGEQEILYSMVLMNAVAFVAPGNSFTLAHELGHNFGLLHAQLYDCGDKSIDIPSRCTSVAYGDYFDVMGQGNMHYQAWYKKLIGWLDQASIAQVTASGEYHLSPLVTPNSETLALEIPISYNHYPTAKSYFVEYRQQEGFDAVSPYMHQPAVFVRLSLPNSVGNASGIIAPQPNNYPNNGFLTVGQSYYDSIHGILIQFKDIRAGQAVVRVIIPDTGCGNGIVEAAEECDDANTVVGDGCLSSCQHEVLGSATFGQTKKLKVFSSNNRAVAFNQTSGELHVIDVPSNGQLQTNSQLTIAGGAKAVDFSGNTLVVVSATQLLIYDATVAAVPTLRATYNLQTSEMVRDVIVRGTVAYIVLVHGVEAVDISDQITPQFVSSYRLTNQDVQFQKAIAAPAGLYVLATTVLNSTAGVNAVWSINTTNPAAMTATAVGSPTIGHFPSDMELVGDELYVTDNSAGVQVLSPTTGVAPRHVSLPRCYVPTIMTGNGEGLLLIHCLNAVFSYSISAGQAPQPVGQYQTSGTDLHIHDSLLLVWNENPSGRIDVRRLIWPACGDGVVQPLEVCDDANGLSDDLCSVDCHPTLMQPQNVRAQMSGTGVRVLWNESGTAETSVVVERKTFNSAYAAIAILPANTIEYTDTSIRTSTQYYYRVRLSNDFGFSEYSNETTVKTPRRFNSPPDGIVELEWSDRTDR
jgi:cysteine-rich repeat protein